IGVEQQRLVRLDAPAVGRARQDAVDLGPVCHAAEPTRAGRHVRRAHHATVTSGRLRVLTMADMRYRRLGSSGLVVSCVGIGTNTFSRKVDEAGVRAVVDAAFEHGVNLFDTADIYGNPPGGSESLLGRALRGRRDDVVIATKFGMDMQGANGVDHGARGARRYIARAVEASLRRLETDHIDLYQMHETDPGTPIEETLSALDDLVRAGKVRYIGNSNFAGWQIAEAAWQSKTNSWTPFISAQNQYNWLR